MPMDRSRYPKDWPEISRRIRERDGNRCKWCGVPNHEYIARNEAGDDWVRISPLEADYAREMDYGGVSYIVLTVAHLGVPKLDGSPGDKHDKMDCRDENLAALCQRCHLNFDREDHIRNAAETCRRKKIEAGQLPLVEIA